MGPVDLEISRSSSGASKPALRLLASVALALHLAAPAGRGQELEPRALTNVPVGTNFVALGYRYAQGNADEHGAHFHANHLAVFTGATSDEHGTEFTLGAEYVRRFGSRGRWGLGGFGEAILAEHTEWVLAGSLSFFATNQFWLQTGSGVELFKEVTSETGGARSAEGEVEAKSSFLVRVGLGYNMQLGILTVAPVVFLDLVRNTQTLVWGVNLGTGF